MSLGWVAWCPGWTDPLSPTLPIALPWGVVVSRAVSPLGDPPALTVDRPPAMTLPLGVVMGSPMSHPPVEGCDNAPLSGASVWAVNTTRTHAPTQHPAHDRTPVPAPVPGGVHPPALPGDLADRVADLRSASKADNTRRAYLSDWRAWTTWCQRHGFDPLPAHPDTVSAYLADQADRLKVSTLARHVATISKAHAVAGVANPCRETAVRDTLAGLRRVHGTPPREAAALVAAPLVATLDAIPTDLAGLRDRALLLVGWSLALRRSEVAALTWGDVVADPNGSGGLVVTLRASKTDHARTGEVVGLAPENDPGLCPVAALTRWRDAVAHENAAAVEPGAPVFVAVSRWGHLGGAPLSGYAVAGVIRKRTQAAGLPVEYGGHSLRKGLITTAYLAGVPDSRVMATSRHRGVAMLRRYQQTGDVVSQAAGRGLLTQAVRGQGQ